jgi:DNA uptake protein ComE-like DNA-binding protein
MVDLNTAPRQQLAELQGVGEKASYDLCVWRPFRSWEEVSSVPGFDPERVEAIRRAGAILSPPRP